MFRFSVLTSRTVHRYNVPGYWGVLAAVDELTCHHTTHAGVSEYFPHMVIQNSSVLSNSYFDLSEIFNF